MQVSTAGAGTLYLICTATRCLSYLTAPLKPHSRGLEARLLTASRH